jgi:hypothetical protein
MGSRLRVDLVAVYRIQLANTDHATNCRLHVKNLDPEVFTNHRALVKPFSLFGQVKSARLCTPRHQDIDVVGTSRQQRVFGFVEFYDHKVALKAKAKLNHQLIGNLALSVSFAYPRAKRGQRAPRPLVANLSDDTDDGNTAASYEDNSSGYWQQHPPRGPSRFGRRRYY